MAPGSPLASSTNASELGRSFGRDRLVFGRILTDRWVRRAILWIVYTTHRDAGDSDGETHLG